MSRAILVTTTMVTLILAGCLSGDDDEKLTQIGSSTVFPLAQLWAEEFDGADISVSGGGSSKGLESLILGEADLGDASRLMKGKDFEKQGCPATDVNDDGTAKAACKGVLPHKWVVAYDVLAVVINNDNDWATQLNYTQLYKIFTDDDPAEYWDEVPGLNDTAPHEKIEIYAPDSASGTYDFFFEEIIPNWGKDDQQAGTRLESGDGVYTGSALDEVTLNAIKGQKYAIGYFGFAYYKQNPNEVQTVDVADGDANFEEASLANVASYPMSRPLHIYTDDNSNKRDVVAEYLQYILSDEAQPVVDEVGYVRLSAVDNTLMEAQRTAAAAY